MPSKPTSNKSKKGSQSKSKIAKKPVKSKTKTASRSTQQKTSRRRSVSPQKAKSSRTLASKKAVKRVAKVPSNDGDFPLQIGAPAPDFSLADETGKLIHLSDFHGKQVVLYFYPKDDTPGCTKEACAFRDGIQEVRHKGAAVLGVSADSVESHRKFSDKFQLNFPLLSDETKTMLEAYGVWKEKSMYGRKFMGIERTTVLIKEDGTVGRIWPKVKVDGHFLEVLKALG
ncbi:MAG: thioredoxin-dependent thiol peroxidase [Nitrospirales bacterium]|nr:thioredoxin-dependent thiol peroxidase [Nitrospirales bacterium]